jgi:hypothetical protein
MPMPRKAPAFLIFAEVFAGLQRRWGSFAFISKGYKLARIMHFRGQKTKAMGGRADENSE